MRRLAVLLLVLSACAPAQMPPPATTPSQQTPPVAATPVHSPNALTPVSNTAPRAIVQPTIRVGLLSDQDVGWDSWLTLGITAGPTA